MAKKRKGCSVNREEERESLTERAREESNQRERRRMLHGDCAVTEGDVHSEGELDRESERRVKQERDAQKRG